MNMHVKNILESHYPESAVPSSQCSSGCYEMRWSQARQKSQLTVLAPRPTEFLAKRVCPRESCGRDPKCCSLIAVLIGSGSGKGWVEEPGLGEVEGLSAPSTQV